eukprot:TRINITY_DN1645_c1_g1_i1.p1 TRINITY_DN1645_c1_g1~~TRINITY_DN1645_c1_g1_i1.p1  ORF type:complete len:553 (+),score=147.15 TRINITY_DN1645_c1_g1_i1:20-1678(+)
MLSLHRLPKKTSISSGKSNALTSRYSSVKSSHPRWNSTLSQIAEETRMKNELQSDFLNRDAESINATEADRSVIINDRQITLDPMIKVFATTASPNHFLPWQMKSSRDSTGSGFIFNNNGTPGILTNAHVVANQTFVSVRRHGLPNRFIAKVESIGHDCDIAMLTVEDPFFWKGVQPLELGDVPSLQDEVSVVGYPTGGDNISITNGVVSRIELSPYVHGATNLLSIQIDAAINPGNSGGPVIQDGKVAGIAFQNLPTAENIGFIIPVPIIKHFLEDKIRNPRYMGFPALGVQCQPMENPFLRKFFKLKAEDTGLLVTWISPLSKAKNVLQLDDVITKVDQYQVANDGTVRFSDRGDRVAFDHVFHSKFLDQSVNLKILRNGEPLEVNVSLTERDTMNLVPIHTHDSRPSYFVHGGLVFTKFVQPYLHEYGSEWYNSSPRRLSYIALNSDKERAEQEVVILAHVLADEVNWGYNTACNLIVKKFNGIPIENLRQLSRLVEQNKEPHLRFDLDEYMVIILDAETTKAANKRILEKYFVPSAKSPDLLQDPRPG